MQADLAILQDHARVTRSEGQWILADHLDAALAEIKATRAQNLVENVGCDPGSLARKYDWISKQDGGTISAADVARDIRESFGIKAEGNGLADERDVFASARTLPDPYDDRPGPWYDMKRVRDIEAKTGKSFREVDRPEIGERGEECGLERGTNATSPEIHQPPQ